MFDVGFSELVLLAVVALVVLGPEKLPHAARMAGAWLGRIRRTVTSIQIEIEKEVAAAELKARMEQEIERLKSAANPVAEEFKSVENSIRDSLHDSAGQPPLANLPTAETPTTPAVIEPDNAPSAATASVLPASAADVAVPVNISKSQPL